MANLESEMKTIDRYKGCIVGGAVGDALGAPAEFLSPIQIKERYGVLSAMLPDGPHARLEGQTTDDTDNTFCIIGSLIDNQGYVPKDIAKRFLLWYQAKPVDIGNTTRTSLSILAQGQSWRQSGRVALSLGARAGNGSLMRTEPIGLYFRGRPKDIDKAAKEISAITHADIDCILACQIASHLVAFLATGYSRDDSIGLLKEMYPSNSKAGDKLRKALDGGYNRDKFGYVLNTLGIALTSFVEAASFEDAIVRAINFGWDTDTQAKVAGVFAGSLWGVEQIPARWKSKLNPVSGEEFEKKAEKLYMLNKQITT